MSKTMYVCVGDSMLPGCYAGPKVYGVVYKSKKAAGRRAARSAGSLYWRKEVMTLRQAQKAGIQQSSMVPW